MRLFPKRFFVRIDCLRFAQTSPGELTQSPYNACGIESLFHLSALASKLATRQIKKPSTLCVGGFVIRIGFKPMTYCLAYPYGFRRSAVADLWSGL